MTWTGCGSTVCQKSNAGTGWGTGRPGTFVLPISQPCSLLRSPLCKSWSAIPVSPRYVSDQTALLQIDHAVLWDKAEAPGFEPRLQQPRFTQPRSLREGSAVQEKAPGLSLKPGAFLCSLPRNARKVTLTLRHSVVIANSVVNCREQPVSRPWPFANHRQNALML